MTKLSDALRGAADRAPVGDVTVAVETAARRVRRRRTMRSAANGAVGVGAVGLLAVGLIAPSWMGDSGDANPALTAHDLPPTLDGAVGDFGPEAFSREEMLTCGVPLSYREPGESDPRVVASVEGADGATVVTDPAGTLTLSVAPQTEGVTLGGASVLVLWDSTVVGSSQLLPEYHLEGDSLRGGIELYNCFDGLALPPGAYTVLVVQEVWEVSQPDTPEPLLPSPAPSPSASALAPLAEPPVTDPAKPGDDIPVEGVDRSWTVMAAPIELVIEGDVPENPFARYLEAPVPPDVPENFLTPAIARDLFLANLAGSTWDMAPGTQRWLMNSDGFGDTGEQSWEQNYFGCSWDGATGVSFPSRSAEMDLIDVSVNAPSAIDVSYGWVVEANPVITTEVSNTSEYVIPGFYGPWVTLYLVQDGRVVAEAYPAETERSSTFEMLNPSLSSAELLALEMGLFEPGAQVSGEFLWRDVNGCWSNDRPMSVSGGQYTLLAAHSFHVSNFPDYGWAEPAYRDGEGVDSQGSADAAAEIAPEPGDEAIMPYPYENYEWVELQLWTSLGTVTVTTR